MVMICYVLIDHCVSDLDLDPLTKDEDLTPEVAAEVGTGGGELKSQSFYFFTLIVNISCFFAIEV